MLVYPARWGGCQGIGPQPVKCQKPVMPLYLQGEGFGCMLAIHVTASRRRSSLLVSGDCSPDAEARPGYRQVDGGVMGEGLLCLLQGGSRIIGRKVLKRKHSV